MDDTVESLRLRVLEREHELYPETLQKIATGEIDAARLGAFWMTVIPAFRQTLRVTPHCHEGANAGRRPGIGSRGDGNDIRRRTPLDSRLRGN